MESGEWGQESAAYVALRRAQNRYGDIITRRAWEELDQVVDERCTLSLSLGDRQETLVGPTEIGRFIGGALERFSFFEFVILNTVADIDLDRRRARARMYIWEIRLGRDDGLRRDAFGVYHDELEADDAGHWRFVDRHYQSMSRAADPTAAVDQVVFDVDFNPGGARP